MTEMVTVMAYEAARYSGGWPPENFASAIEWMQAKMAEIPEPFRASAKIRIASENGYEDDHYACLEVTYERPETADEEAVRLARQARAVAHHEAQERQRYEALKAKFG